MRRDLLPIEVFPAWAKLNSVQLNGLRVCRLPGNRGSGLVVTAATLKENSVLMTVPQELILSLEHVWIMAKSDVHLREVLEAVGDYSRSARGAILIFLILQMTSSTSDLSEKVGVSNPLKEYLKFLPARVHLPTFWNEAERAHLRGTSLEAALNTKLSFLDREFTRLKDATTSISWCQRHWWDPETGHLSLDDWKQVDALYRSRALDLPGTGHAMVPCIDMANHAQGDSTVALYDTDINGDGVLVMREGKGLVAGEEVTITYGDDKGACEMLFSYGFIEESMLSAKELFLDLEFPEDDPLRYAKKAVSKCAPGFRLFYQGDLIEWEGTFIWLLCVNEEDGFQIQYLQNYRGEKELKVSWKDNHVKDMSHLHGFLKDSTLWDVFNLRALIILQERVWTQLSALEGSKMDVKEMGKLEDINASVRDNALQLRDLEETLLLHAYEEFEERKTRLLESNIVQDYLQNRFNENSSIAEEDFS